MRVFSRIALLFFAVAVLSVPAAVAQPVVASCPLTLVSNNPGSSQFYQSPHGVFRFGSQVFVLRGQTLSTYTVTDLGDMQIAREDFIGSLGARESNGGVTFNGGYLFISSEAGLEIYDLRNVRAGGNSPILVSRTPGLHYRRMAVNGNTLAAVFPAIDLPCYTASGSFTCFNSIDIYSIANLSSPVRIGTISTFGTQFGGFNDVAFNYGNLFATGFGGTFGFSMSNPALPLRIFTDVTPGTFLVSNSANLLAVGNDATILTYGINPSPLTLTPITLHTTATLRIEHANPIIFHPQATFDEAGSRLITMIDELDPQTLKPARTFAFDVFDYGVPMYEGRDPRVYEQVSFTQGDEVKWNPTAVGTLVYVVGEMTGMQTYGACGQMTGKIEFDSVSSTPCGGAEIHGWVTGALKIANVELFIDGTSLGAASLSGPPRIDIPSTTPVTPWRVAVNLDTTARGEHILRAVGTDANGNRRQFSSQRVFFPGPGSNCFVRKRAVAH